MGSVDKGVGILLIASKIAACLVYFMLVIVSSEDGLKTEVLICSWAFQWYSSRSQAFIYISLPSQNPREGVALLPHL